MTPEQIRQIASEYAQKTHTDLVYILRTTRDMSYFLEWLTERYCVVERSKVVELCELTVNNASSDDFGLIDGLTDLVCDMFNEEYHNVIENNGSETFNK